MCAGVAQTSRPIGASVPGWPFPTGLALGRKEQQQQQKTLRTIPEIEYNQCSHLDLGEGSTKARSSIGVGASPNPRRIWSGSRWCLIVPRGGG